MNYKVTFYNNLEHLITQRKANFTHKLAKISSKIFNAIAARVEGTGTSAQKLLRMMVNQSEKDKVQKLSCRPTVITVRIPDFINDTDQKNQISVRVVFSNKMEKNNGKSVFDVEGATFPKIINRELYISGIDIYVKFNVDKDTINYSKDAQTLIDNFNSTLVHELAHAKDNNLVHQFSVYGNPPKSKDKTVQYLYYFTEPTELRSHLNEVIRGTKRERFNSPKKIAKSTYKNWDNDDQESLSPQMRNYVNSTVKKNFKQALANKANTSVDDLSKKLLGNNIDMNFKNTCSNNMRKFLIDYHIAFVRDNSPTEKKRYYNLLFPNSNPPSFDKLKQFFDVIISIYRSLTRVGNDLKKSFSYHELIDNKDACDKKMTQLQSIKDFMWDESIFKDAFEKYDTKLLKKSSKKAIQAIRLMFNIPSKAMIKNS